MDTRLHHILYLYWVWNFTVLHHKIKRFFKRTSKITHNLNYEPEVTLFITAYNEKDYVAQKMLNSRALDYPKEKLHIVWVTDGSDDGTPEMLKAYDQVSVHHLDERKGKVNAMNRGMKLVNTPLVVFSDANTMLGPNLSDVLFIFLKSQLSDVFLGRKELSIKKKTTHQVQAKAYTGSMNLL